MLRSKLAAYCGTMYRFRKKERCGMCTFPFLNTCNVSCFAFSHSLRMGKSGHELWKRDFTGASGLLGIVLDRDYPMSAIAAFIDGLELFSLGASWGGYESLILHFDPHQYRTATSWRATSPTLRLHVGLEDPADLIDDLDAAFRRLEGVS